MVEVDVPVMLVTVKLRLLKSQTILGWKPREKAEKERKPILRDHLNSIKVGEKINFKENMFFACYGSGPF